MSIVTDLVERWRALVLRGREERDMAEEHRFHLELETEHNILAGMTPAAARRRAVRTFGGEDRIREHVRDARGVRPLEELVRDVRHSVRALLRRPAFTVVAVATLALGIGASTAMFTVVNSVLLRPLAYAGPDRLVALWDRRPEGGHNFTSPASFAAWREQSTSFVGLTAWTDRPLNVTGAGDPLEVRARWALDDYFAVLGEPAHLGRTLLPGDEGADYVVLSHGLWRDRFGGDPDVVGRTLTISDFSYTVVGVMPGTFHDVGGDPELWLPMPPLDREFPGRYLRALGRLAPGATLASARAEMSTIAARIEAATRDGGSGWGVAVIPLQDDVTGHARPALLVLLGAVSLLLLIACANVGNLFLGRAAARRRELAVRSSLGAGRARIVAHVLTEVIVVAALAGTLGVLLAYWSVGALVGALPAELALPRLAEIALDRRALGFAFVVSLLTGAAFGAVPALTAARVQPGRTLRDVTRSATARSPLRGALVVAQVALAVMLLAGAGLLVRTVHNLMSVDPGLRAEGVLTLRLTLPGQRYDPAARVVFVEELVERLASLPGASAAGTVAWLPLGGAKSSTSFRREDRPAPAPGEEPGADIRVVGGDYFAAMGVAVRSGRVFDRTDTPDAPNRFVVNEALARSAFPGEDPVGKRIAYEWDDWVAGEIIGVVASVHETALDVAPAAAIYRAFAQEPWPAMSALVRTAGDPLALAAGAAAAVRAVDPGLPVAAVRPLGDIVADSLVRQRLSMIVLTAFAAVSLLLVLIGLYGVIANAVAQQTREIGVRIALGARRGDVVRMVVGRGMRYTAVGLALGLAGAVAAGRLLAGQLFGVAPGDPVTLAAVALILAATALLASYLPAARAARIDPAQVIADA